MDNKKAFTDHVDLRIHLRSKFGFIASAEYTEFFDNEEHDLVLYYQKPLNVKEFGAHVGTWDKTANAGWGFEKLVEVEA
jgi:hypothetical protein